MKYLLFPLFLSVALGFIIPHYLSDIPTLPNPKLSSSPLRLRSSLASRWRNIERVVRGKRYD
jgi:hypothetical protein